MILSYLGSKQTLLPSLDKVMMPLIARHGGKERCVFGDLFGGSGCVSNHYKSYVKRVVSSDMELYSYVLSKALLTTVYTPRLARLIDMLNSRQLLKPVKGLVWKNFTPHSPPQHARMFFTCENGARIDAIRIAISRLHQEGMVNYKEFVFLLASLLASVSRYSNTSGTFRAYLKSFCTRSLRQFKILPVHKNTCLATNGHKVYKTDVNNVVKTHSFDIAYLDPPYNTCHYGAYYSLLNYVCLYNPAVKLTGVGVMENYNKSAFGFARTAKHEFRCLLTNIRAKHIVLSYSASAVLSCKDMVSILMRKGSVTMYKVWHKTYKPHNSIRSTHLKEFIFVVDCTQNSASKTFKEVWLSL